MTHLQPLDINTSETGVSIISFLRYILDDNKTIIIAINKIIAIGLTAEANANSIPSMIYLTIPIYDCPLNSLYFFVI